MTECDQYIGEMRCKRKINHKPPHFVFYKNARNADARDLMESMETAEKIDEGDTVWIRAVVYRCNDRQALVELRERIGDGPAHPYSLNVPIEDVAKVVHADTDERRSKSMSGSIDQPSYLKGWNDCLILHGLNRKSQGANAAAEAEVAALRAQLAAVEALCDSWLPHYYARKVSAAIAACGPVVGGGA